MDSDLIRTRTRFRHFHLLRTDLRKMTDTFLLASIVAPFTLAPVTGLPVCPSVTVEIIGKLSATIGKPVSFKNELALKASKAKRFHHLV